MSLWKNHKVQNSSSPQTAESAARSERPGGAESTEAEVRWSQKWEPDAQRQARVRSRSWCY